MLARMDHAAFLREAWKTLAEAVVRAGVMAGLHGEPETLRKSVKRRCLARLKRLAVLLRRLILLMALALDLAPEPPRRGRNYFETDRKPSPKRHAFRLAPAPCTAPSWSVRGVFAVPARPGPVPAAPLIARWQAMLDVLKHCDRRARRLARTLARWRAGGEPRPVVLPLATRRLPAALGLLSGALTVRLAAALDRWPDTG